MCMESGKLFSDRLRMIFLKIPLMEKTPEQWTVTSIYGCIWLNIWKR